MLPSTDLLPAEEQARLKRAGLYMRVSTVDQHPETQLLDLRQMAAQRGYEIVHEYTDRISGAKARRPGLDELMRMPSVAASTLCWSGLVIGSPGPPGTSSKCWMNSIG
jgi:predicted site-specific integrase-resolvase